LAIRRAAAGRHDVAGRSGRVQPSGTMHCPPAAPRPVRRQMRRPVRRPMCGAPAQASGSLALATANPYSARDIHPKEAAMATERTFSIIKPDATRRNLAGKINAVLEDAGLRIVAQRRIHMTRTQAETFYDVHAARPFFRDLVTFMISGPVVVQVLEGEDAVARYRDIMGATNPANAAPGTIRKLFAESIEANSVHGSDSVENAAAEIGYFFAGCDIVG
jgi:nucleoside-diphosphate kinase